MSSKKYLISGLSSACVLGMSVGTFMVAGTSEDARAQLLICSGEVCDTYSRYNPGGIGAGSDGGPGSVPMGGMGMGMKGMKGMKGMGSGSGMMGMMGMGSGSGMMGMMGMGSNSGMMGMGSNSGMMGMKDKEEPCDCEEYDDKQSDSISGASRRSGKNDGSTGSDAGVGASRK